jgi:YHS domain-containing protein
MLSYDSACKKKLKKGNMYKIIIILILLIILFYMLRRAARVWIETKPEEATPGKDVMIQDPVCKVYVAAGSAIIEEVSGQQYYFCSQDCAKHFRREGKT